MSQQTVATIIPSLRMHPEISLVSNNNIMVIQKKTGQQSDFCNKYIYLPIEDKDDEYDDTYNPAFM